MGCGDACKSPCISSSEVSDDRECAGISWEELELQCEGPVSEGGECILLGDELPWGDRGLGCVDVCESSCISSSEITGDREVPCEWGPNMV